jgi:hypothetical protein
MVRERIEMVSARDRDGKRKDRAERKTTPNCCKLLTFDLRSYLSQAP